MVSDFRCLLLITLTRQCCTKFKDLAGEDGDKRSFTAVSYLAQSSFRAFPLSVETLACCIEEVVPKAERFQCRGLAKDEMRKISIYDLLDHNGVRVCLGQLGRRTSTSTSSSSRQGSFLTCGPVFVYMASYTTSFFKNIPNLSWQMLLNFLNIGCTGVSVFLFSHLLAIYPFVVVYDHSNDDSNMLYLDFEGGGGDEHLNLNLNKIRLIIFIYFHVFFLEI